MIYWLYYLKKRKKQLYRVFIDELIRRFLDFQENPQKIKSFVPNITIGEWIKTKEYHLIDIENYQIILITIYFEKNQNKKIILTVGKIVTLLVSPYLTFEDVEKFVKNVFFYLKELSDKEENSKEEDGGGGDGEENGEN